MESINKVAKTVVDAVTYDDYSSKYKLYKDRWDVGASADPADTLVQLAPDIKSSIQEYEREQEQQARETSNLSPTEKLSPAFEAEVAKKNNTPKLIDRFATSDEEQVEQQSYGNPSFSKTVLFDRGNGTPTLYNKGESDKLIEGFITLHNDEPSPVFANFVRELQKDTKYLVDPNKVKEFLIRQELLDRRKEYDFIENHSAIKTMLAGMWYDMFDGSSVTNSWTESHSISRDPTVPYRDANGDYFFPQRDKDRMNEQLVNALEFALAGAVTTAVVVSAPLSAGLASVGAGISAAADLILPRVAVNIAKKAAARSVVALVGSTFKTLSTAAVGVYVGDVSLGLTKSIHNALTGKGPTEFDKLGITGATKEENEALFARYNGIEGLKTNLSAQEFNPISIFKNDFPVVLQAALIGFAAKGLLAGGSFVVSKYTPKGKVKLSDTEVTNQALLLKTRLDPVIEDSIAQFHGIAEGFRDVANDGLNSLDTETLTNLHKNGVEPDILGLKDRQILDDFINNFVPESLKNQNKSNMINIGEFESFDTKLEFHITPAQFEKMSREQVVLSKIVSDTGKAANRSVSDLFDLISSPDFYTTESSVNKVFDFLDRTLNLVHDNSSITSKVMKLKAIEEKAAKYSFGVEIEREKYESASLLKFGEKTVQENTYFNVAKKRVSNTILPKTRAIKSLKEVSSINDLKSKVLDFISPREVDGILLGILQKRTSSLIKRNAISRKDIPSTLERITNAKTIDELEHILLKTLKNSEDELPKIFMPNKESPILKRLNSIVSKQLKEEVTNFKREFTGNLGDESTISDLQTLLRENETFSSIDKNAIFDIDVDSISFKKTRAKEEKVYLDRVRSGLERTNPSISYPYRKNVLSFISKNQSNAIASNKGKLRLKNQTTKFYNAFGEAYNKAKSSSDAMDRLLESHLFDYKEKVTPFAKQFGVSYEDLSAHVIDIVTNPDNPNKLIELGDDANSTLINAFSPFFKEVNRQFKIYRDSSPIQTEVDLTKQFDSLSKKKGYSFADLDIQETDKNYYPQDIDWTSVRELFNKDNLKFDSFVDVLYNALDVKEMTTRVSTRVEKLIDSKIKEELTSVTKEKQKPNQTDTETRLLKLGIPDEMIDFLIENHDQNVSLLSDRVLSRIGQLAKNMNYKTEFDRDYLKNIIVEIASSPSKEAPVQPTETLRSMLFVDDVSKNFLYKSYAQFYNDINKIYGRYTDPVNSFIAKSRQLTSSIGYIDNFGDLFDIPLGGKSITSKSIFNSILSQIGEQSKKGIETSSIPSAGFETVASSLLDSMRGINNGWAIFKHEVPRLGTSVLRGVANIANLGGLGRTILATDPINIMINHSELGISGILSAGRALRKLAEKITPEEARAVNAAAEESSRFEIDTSIRFTQEEQAAMPNAIKVDQAVTKMTKAFHKYTGSTIQTKKYTFYHKMTMMRLLAEELANNNYGLAWKKLEEYGSTPAVFKEAQFFHSDGNVRESGLMINSMMSTKGGRLLNSALDLNARDVVSSMSPVTRTFLGSSLPGGFAFNTLFYLKGTPLQDGLYKTINPFLRGNVKMLGKQLVAGLFTAMFIKSSRSIESGKLPDYEDPAFYLDLAKDVPMFSLAGNFISDWLSPNKTFVDGIPGIYKPVTDLLTGHPLNTFNDIFPLKTIPFVRILYDRYIYDNIYSTFNPNAAAHFRAVNRNAANAGTPYIVPRG